ncbi:MAG: thioredoxin domain-containing protein, partial [Candidatus Falkowbacteria bacterium]|nr:thioredoxin domain-containing protein [Candidatus Falkowbacteria bacterium]
MSLEDRIKLADIKSRHQKAIRAWYKKPPGKISLIILGLVLLIAIYSFLYVLDQVKIIRQEQQNALALNQQKLVEATLYGTDSYYLGTNNPKLIIVEFSDFACPFCQQFSSVIRQAGEKYKDKIKIIIRDFPVISEQSIDLAEAARCAGAQGKFWEMHDALFAKQDDLKKDPASLGVNLRSLATDLKLNADDFSLCLEDKAYLTVIEQNKKDGDTLGVVKTPTWFIGRDRA